MSGVGLTEPPKSEGDGFAVAGAGKYVGIGLVYAWRYTFGLLTPPNTCKYHPSCSQYALGEPLVPTRVGRLRQSGASDKYVVVAGTGPFGQLGPGLAQLALDPVTDDGVPDRLGDRQAEARRVRLVALRTGEPVEDEETGRGRAAAAIHGVEVPRAGQAVAALHGARIVGRAQAESRLRPLARRRLRIACPARVDIRARKPCLRLRRRTLG